MEEELSDRAQPPIEGKEHTVPTRTRSRYRVAKIGCLSIMLTMCACLGTLLVALQSGPVTIGLGGAVLRLGSDSFVLSNYSFRDGTTYFIDLSGSERRDILEFRHTDEDHKLEVVLHHADREFQGDTHLMTFELP